MSNKSDWIRFVVRMPPQLSDDLRKYSVRHNSSLNSEIVSRLDESVKESSRRMDSKDTKISIKEIILEMQNLAKKIDDLEVNDTTLKNELLSKEERTLLSWFNNTKPTDKSLLLNFLPDILSLLKKLS